MVSSTDDDEASACRHRSNATTHEPACAVEKEPPPVTHTRRVTARSGRAQLRRRSSGGGGPPPEGAPPPEPETRRNLDKRTARFRNAKHFVEAIASYRRRHPTLLPPAPGTGLDGGDSDDDDDDAAAAAADRAAAAAAGGSSSRHAVRVFVRKRPLFEYESARGEYNVISVVPATPSHDAADGRERRGSGARVVVHNCVMHADMKVRWGGGASGERTLASRERTPRRGARLESRRGREKRARRTVPAFVVARGGVLRTTRDALASVGTDNGGATRSAGTTTPAAARARGTLATAPRLRRLRHHVSPSPTRARRAHVPPRALVPMRRGA